MSADGRVVAEGFYEGDAIVWDGPRKKVLARVRVGREPVDDVAVSPHGGVVAFTAGEGGVRLWDVDARQWITGAPMAESLSEPIRFSPDGRLVVVHDASIDLWDVRPVMRSRHLDVPGGVQRLAFSSRAAFIAVVDRSGTISSWSTRGGDPARASVAGVPNPDGLALSPSGRLVAATTDTGAVMVWDLANQHNQLSRELPDSGYPESVAFSLDGETVLTAQEDGEHVLVARWDVRHARQLATSTFGSGDPAAVAVSPDGRTAAVSWRPGDVELWDVWRRRRHDSNPPALTENDDRNLLFSPDGRLFAYVGYQTPIRIWDTREQEVTGALEELEPGTDFKAFTFAPDGKTLAVIAGDRLRLWDARTRKPLGKAVEVNAESLSFSGGPGRLVTGLSDGTLVVWTVENGTPTRPRPLQREGERVDTWATAGAREGGLLASGSEDGIVLWDVPSRLQVGVAQDGSRDAMAFSPNGRVFVATSVIWDTSPRSWARKACALASRELTRDEWGQFVGDEPYVRTCATLETGD